MLHWLDGRALSILGLSNSISLLTTSHDKAEQRGSQQRGFTQVHHCAGGIARKASQARGRGGGGGAAGAPRPLTGSPQGWPSSRVNCGACCCCCCCGCWLTGTAAGAAPVPVGGSLCDGAEYAS